MQRLRQEKNVAQPLSAKQAFHSSQHGPLSQAASEGSQFTSVHVLPTNCGSQLAVPPPVPLLPPVFVPPLPPVLVPREPPVATPPLPPPIKPPEAPLPALPSVPAPPPELSELEHAFTPTTVPATRTKIKLSLMRKASVEPTACR